MKTLVNNLVWLALFSLMVCASIYPQISGVAQAMMWVIVSLVMVIALPGLLLAIFADDDQIKSMNTKRKSVIRRLFGYIKLFATFAATAYAGFAVAASFYIIGAFLMIASIHIARERQAAKAD